MDRDLLNEEQELKEYVQEVSDSKYAIASYKATWRELARYVRSLGYGE